MLLERRFKRLVEAVGNLVGAVTVTGGSNQTAEQVAPTLVIRITARTIC
jgi:hypothetical protein